MSMILGLDALGEEHIRKVLADPPLVWKVVAPDDPGMYEEARRTPAPGLLAKLLGRKTAPLPAAVEFALAEEEVARIDLDKSWQGIHYMLTGSGWKGAPPLNFLLAGGTEVGDIEVGYGPARAMMADEVRQVHAALLPLDEAFLRSRFDPQAMMKKKIYPEIWDRDPAADDTFGYCLEYFERLKAFIGATAARGQGVIITIT